MKNVMEIDPKDPRALYNRGFAYALTGEHEAAIADFNATLVIKPDDTIAKKNLDKAIAAKAAQDAWR